jgi:hypothetical protein
MENRHRQFDERQTMSINIIKKIAKESGVKIILCDKKKWGGGYGFTWESYPHSTFNGFKTKNEAYTEWAINTFGLKTLNALIKIYGKGN